MQQWIQSRRTRWTPRRRGFAWDSNPTRSSSTAASRCSGRVEVRGAKNLATKAMVAALLGETPEPAARRSRTSATSTSCAACSAPTASRSPRPKTGSCCSTRRTSNAPTSPRSTRSRAPAASRSCSAARCCTASARRSSPTSAAAASATGRSTSTWMRCARSARSSTRATRASASRRPTGCTARRSSCRTRASGATEQVLLTAVRAEGVTELKNAAIEPEIMDLIAILQKMGAIISVEPNRTIFIEGVEKLHGYTHRALFDRNEAASWASAALATDGDIFVGGAKQQELMTFLNVFRKAGGAFDIHEDGIRFYHPGGAAQAGHGRDRRAPRLHDRLAAAAHRRAHPGARASRSCTRPCTRTGFGFTDALIEMGADIVVHNDGLESLTRRVPRRKLEQAAVITGPTPLHGADVRVPDLRGGFSHLIAALTAEGTSTRHATSASSAAATSTSSRSSRCSARTSPSRARRVADRLAPRCAEKTVRLAVPRGHRHPRAADSRALHVPRAARRSRRRGRSS